MQHRGTAQLGHFACSVQTYQPQPTGDEADVATVARKHGGVHCHRGQQAAVVIGGHEFLKLQQLELMEVTWCKQTGPQQASIMSAWPAEGAPPASAFMHPWCRGACSQHQPVPFTGIQSVLCHALGVLPWTAAQAQLPTYVSIACTVDQQIYGTMLSNCFLQGTFHLR
jgi:hypothetical protein